MRRVVWLTLTLLIGTLLAFAGDDSDYVLDTGDVLSVVVLRHEQFSGEYTVPPNGKVVFHGVGELTVRGLTLAQLTEQIRTRLLERLRNPEVTVSLKSARPPLAFVEGQVNSPGAYAVRPEWRVFELIASANGLKSQPEHLKAVLIRGEETIPVDLVALYHRSDASANLPVQPGDKLLIQRKATIRVTIIGEVGSPGVHILDEGTGVLQALAQVGGVSNSARLSSAFIERQGNLIPVDLYEAVERGNLSANLTLQNGDLLVIPKNLSRFAIVGQVGQPGYYTLPYGQPLLLSDALALAGGTNARAQTSSIFILRMEGNEIRRIRVSYLNFLRRGDLSQNPLILEGDVVFVPEARRFDLSTALSALALINVIDQLNLR